MQDRRSLASSCVRSNLKWLRESWSISRRRTATRSSRERMVPKQSVSKAGRPPVVREQIERALNILTRSFEGGPRDFVVDWVASGRTMLELADELTKNATCAISRQSLAKYLIKVYGDQIQVD